jgi:hypothetical protein
MNSRRNWRYGIGFILLGAILMGCRANRPIASRPVEALNKAELVEEMRKNEYRFSTISAKASVVFIDNKKKSSIKASLRIVKDSAIWINFSYIGFAGARILITPDSVKMINYKNAEYLITELDYLNQLLSVDIDFETIQSLLVGNSSSFDEGEKLRSAIDDNMYFLSSMRKRALKKNRPERKFDKLERKQEKKPEKQDKYAKKQERKGEKYGDLVYSVWLDASSHKILKTVIKDFLNDKELYAEYSNFQEEEAQLFPYNLSFRLKDSGASEIKINYSKITKDKPVKLVFNIPEKYEQIYY